MTKEILIRTSCSEFRAFLQEGFYNGVIVENVHNHNFTEIHIASEGSMTYCVAGKIYTVEGNSILAIPQKCFHSVVSYTDGVKHTAFQISCDITEPTVIPTNEKIIDGFIHEIAKCDTPAGYNTIAAYIAFLCSSISERECVSPNDIRDYGYLIHEFISGNYNRDVKLRELAEYLHLSERQTDRLVLQFKGKPFRRALAEMRVSVAKILISSTDMTLSQIASYVGYDSYSGFWKALHSKDR